MSSTKKDSLRVLTNPSMNDALKTNANNLTNLLKTAGDFVNKVCSVKEQYANNLLSVVETFRKKSTEIKKDRCSLSSSMSTWETFLGEYEIEAQDILKTCAVLTQNISKSLLEESAKRKALCKKIFGFREAGVNKIDKADEASKKYLKEYWDSCAKLNKALSTDQAKEAKQEHYTSLYHNSHNSHVLQLCALNGMQDAFYAKTLPQMLDDLQSVLEDATINMAKIFKDCSRIKKENHEQSANRLSNIEKLFEMVDSSSDTTNFVRNSNNPGIFSPSHVVSVPDNKLLLHSTTEAVLKRKYIALQKKTRHLSNTIEKERNALKSVKGLHDSYIQNPSNGQAEDVDSNILQQKNEIRTNEMHKEITDVQLNLFTPDITRKLHVTEKDLEDDEYDDDKSLLDIYDKRQSLMANVMAKPKTTRSAKHDFIEYTFKKPVSCYYCNKLLKECFT